jgi:hypothetical protein
MSEEAWTEAPGAKKRTPKREHRFTADRAEQLERSTKCRGLAASLRSAAFESEWAAGWEYAGVRATRASRAAPAEAPPADSAAPEYEFKTVPVRDNAWGDAVVMRRRADYAPTV